MRGIALDFCKNIGLDVPKLTTATEAALRPIVPSFVPVDNPLDLATAGMGQADIYGTTARIMLADENVGCAILPMVPGTPQLQMAKGTSLVPLVEAETRPVALVLMGDDVPLAPEFTPSPNSRQRRSVLSLARSRDAGNGASLCLWPPARGVEIAGAWAGAARDPAAG